jgi:hypothetical protein
MLWKEHVMNEQHKVDSPWPSLYTKRYKVVAKMTTYLYVYVNACSNVEALDTAKDIDGGEFIPFDQGIVQGGDWEIVGATLEVSK